MADGYYVNGKRRRALPKVNQERNHYWLEGSGHPSIRSHSSLICYNKPEMNLPAQVTDIVASPSHGDVPMAIDIMQLSRAGPHHPWMPVTSNNSLNATNILSFLLRLEMYHFRGCLIR